MSRLGPRAKAIYEFAELLVDHSDAESRATTWSAFMIGLRLGMTLCSEDQAWAVEALQELETAAQSVSPELSQQHTQQMERQTARKIIATAQVIAGDS